MQSSLEKLYLHLRMRRKQGICEPFAWGMGWLAGQKRTRRRDRVSGAARGGKRELKL